MYYLVSILIVVMIQGIALSVLIIISELTGLLKCDHLVIYIAIYSIMVDVNCM